MISIEKLAQIAGKKGARLSSATKEKKEPKRNTKQHGRRQ
jgi:hypothetical protein